MNQHYIFFGCMAVAIMLIFVFTPKSEGEKAVKKVCKDCGSVDSGEEVNGGSFALEVFLWLFFIVPGLFYTLWRVGSSQLKCKSCGGKVLIPVDSPEGKRITAKNEAA